MAVRVLHLVHWMNRGGIEMWIMYLLRTIDTSKYHIDICCKGPRVGELAAEVKKLGAKIYHCELRPTHLSFKYKFRQLLKEGKYDIVHIHTETYSGYPAGMAKDCGLGVIVTYHNTNFIDPWCTDSTVIKFLRKRYCRWSVRLACERSDFVTCCSQAVLKMLRDNFDTGDLSKQHIWYCGVPVPSPISDDHRQHLRQELALAPDSPLVIHVGSFRKSKNHEGLIRIAKKIVIADPSVKFLLVGDGPLYPHIKKQIQQANLQNNIKLLGVRSDVPALLALADVFLFPSTTMEGLPVSVIEAQMTGLPVVASDIASVREAVDAGKTAFLFPLADEESMASAVLNLLGDTQKRTDMGVASRLYAQGKFSPEESLKKLYQLYDALLHHES